MVWGMYLPSTGGAFGPYGKEEGTGAGVHMKSGWADRLQAHYRSQPPEIGKAMWGDDWDSLSNRGDYAFKVVKKFQYEIGKIGLGNPWEIVAPIQSHEPPSYFLTEKSFSQLGSIISLQNRMWAVDETVKAIIEEFEPGLHQFYPLEIRMPRARVYPKTYFTFVVGRWLESFSMADCNPNAALDKSTPSFPRYSISEYKESITGLALCRSGFEGSHCWRERGLNEWLLCFSDELMNRLTGCGLLLPKHYRMKEV